MSRTAPYDLIVAGVGGQGSLFASKVIAQAAFAQDVTVQVAETYGVAQRGGSVFSQIRLGHVRCGPLIPRGQCRLILGLEPIEALRRAAEYLRPEGDVVLNTRVNLPLETRMGRQPAPDIRGIRRQFDRLGVGRLLSLDALALALEAGGIPTLNVVMLGALSSMPGFPLTYEALIQGLKAAVKPALLEPNLASLARGRAYGLAQQPPEPPPAGPSPGPRLRHGH